MDRRRRLIIWAVIGVLALIVTYLVMVRWQPGQRLDFSALEGRKATPLWARRAVARSVQILTPIAVLAFVVLAALRGGRDRGGRAVASLVAAAPVAALVAQLLKQALPRVELLPGSWLDPSNSYPSGHVATLTAAVLGALACAHPLHRARFAAAGLVVVVVQVVGVGVSGWHRPSDVVGGIALAVAVGGATSAVIAGCWQVSAVPRVPMWFESPGSIRRVALRAVSIGAAGYVLARIWGRPSYGSFALHMLVALSVVALAVIVVLQHARLVGSADAAFDDDVVRSGS